MQFIHESSFFALNCIFFPANEVATLKTKQPIRFQGLFKVTDQIAGKWKTKSITWQILQLLFPKLLLSPPPKKKKNGWFFSLWAKLLEKTKKKLLFLDIHNCACMGKDWKNAWALGTMQSAVFKKFRTNCSQNDFDELRYFHVVLVVCVVVVVVFFLLVCFFSHLRYDWQLS